jgi:hypothetical protein
MSMQLALEALKLLTPSWKDGERLLEAEMELNADLLEELKKYSGSSLINELLTPLNARTKRRIDIGTLDTKSFGKIFKIEFILDGEIKFYQNYDELVSRHPVEPPPSFLLTSEPEGFVYFPCNTPTGKLKHYFEVHDIWNYLLKKSDDHNSKSIMFLYRQKLEIFNKYCADDLTNGFDGLAKFISLIDSDEKHDLEKGHILQNTLITMLSNIDRSERFTYFLKNFSMFSLRFDEAYQAYVVGFSFDELREEYEEKYRDYMVKINDLISSSLTKSLAIPATIFLTSTRTQAIVSAKGKTPIDELIAANFGIALVAVIVSIVICLMIFTELHSLKSIRAEYNSLMSRLEDKSAEAYSTIQTFREHLSVRLVYARHILIMLIFLAIANGLGSVYWVISRTVNFSINIGIAEVASFCRNTLVLLSRLLFC